MLGPRQQQIIAALADGPCSLAALEHQAGVERGQLRDALKRLESAGLIQMVGKRGKGLRRPTRHKCHRTSEIHW
jgi:DNA-binding GntR family transcriptional regulator